MYSRRSAAPARRHSVAGVCGVWPKPSPNKQEPPSLEIQRRFAISGPSTCLGPVLPSSGILESSTVRSQNNVSQAVSNESMLMLRSTSGDRGRDREGGDLGSPGTAGPSTATHTFFPTFTASDRSPKRSGKSRESSTRDRVGESYLKVNADIERLEGLFENHIYHDEVIEVLKGIAGYIHGFEDQHARLKGLLLKAQAEQRQAAHSLHASQMELSVVRDHRRNLEEKLTSLRDACVRLNQGVASCQELLDSLRAQAQ